MRGHDNLYLNSLQQGGEGGPPPVLPTIIDVEVPIVYPGEPAVSAGVLYVRRIEFAGTTSLTLYFEMHLPSSPVDAVFGRTFTWGATPELEGFAFYPVHFVVVPILGIADASKMHAIRFSLNGNGSTVGNVFKLPGAGDSPNASIISTVTLVL